MNCIYMFFQSASWRSNFILKKTKKLWIFRNFVKWQQKKIFTYTTITCVSDITCFAPFTTNMLFLIIYVALAKIRRKNHKLYVNFTKKKFHSLPAIVGIIQFVVFVFLVFIVSLVTKEFLWTGITTENWILRQLVFMCFKDVLKYANT